MEEKKNNEVAAPAGTPGSPRKVGNDGPVYRKVLYKGPPEHATPLWLISCDEGWRSSIVCEGMYEWAADWLLEQIQGKPFAPTNRPGARSSSVPLWVRQASPRSN